MPTNYFDQITEALNGFYLKHPIKITPIEQLQLRRNQLIREIRGIDKKQLELEQEISSYAEAIKTQVLDLNLSIEILDEVFVNQEQIDVLTNFAERDAYLSEVYEACEKELIDVELEITRLQTQDLEASGLSIAA